MYKKRREPMWEQAITVAIVGFSVVFAGLWMLALGVKIMSFFCRLAQKEKRGKTDDANIPAIS
jgi:Na+-transporting methylmalonyl-CoA/oxaloacetate decarboxylase gamma subunit